MTYEIPAYNYPADTDQTIKIDAANDPTIAEGLPPQYSLSYTINSGEPVNLGSVTIEDFPNAVQQAKLAAQDSIDGVQDKKFDTLALRLGFQRVP